MFYFARSFNQPLNDWNVSNVRGMFAMFSHAYNFNQPLNNWNVSNVRGMFRMFYMRINFNIQENAPWYDESNDDSDY
tara:strand:+ start:1222 stop:1452 length:231 start_codon:yes stop_codon:yes gene_type:complete